MIYIVLDDFLYIYYIKMLIVFLNRYGWVFIMRIEFFGRVLKDFLFLRFLGNSDIIKFLEDLDN